MSHRYALTVLLLATGCGGITVFPEKGLYDSGMENFDPAGSGGNAESTDTGLTGNNGSGAGNGGSGGGSGSGSGGTGDGGSGSGSSGSGSSGSSGSGGDGSGSGSSGSSGSGSSGSSGSGSSGSGSGSGSSGSGSGSGSSGSGSGSSGSGSGSGSSGSGSGGSSGGPSGGAGTYVIEQAIGEVTPYYYPCEYVFDVYFSTSATHCSGCDFVLDGNFTFNTAASTSGASYCSVTSRTFAATLAHDSDYLGSLSASMYYYGGLWYPLDYTASYRSGVWSMDWGFRDTLYYFWYYTDYRTLDAVVY